MYYLRLIGLCTAIFATTELQVSASEPPQSCANKFVGSWDWISSTGIHTHHVFGSDGYANCSENSFCTKSETWTCNGNQFTYNNSMYDTVLTLSGDGRTMTGMGGFPPNLQTVVRVGAAPHANAASPSAREQADRSAAEREGDSFVIQAHALLGSLRTSTRRYAEQELQQAINRYASAAEQYEIAGNLRKAKWAKEQEAKLINSRVVSSGAEPGFSGAARNEQQSGKRHGYTREQCLQLKKSIDTIKANGGDARIEPGARYRCLEFWN